jgi:hypothetical protein
MKVATEPGPLVDHVLQTAGRVVDALVDRHGVAPADDRSGGRRRAADREAPPLRARSPCEIGIVGVAALTPRRVVDRHDDAARGESRCDRSFASP